MTEETKPTKEETLAELKRKIKELEGEVTAGKEQIDSMKKKEEGWLIWTKNPAYDGMTAGLSFTDGMAFVRKERKFPGYGDETAEYFVNNICSDFGYQCQFFTKDEMDELQKRMTNRTRERKEVEARMGTQTEMLEKLMESHRF